jgi:hypothetical protein
MMSAPYARFVITIPQDERTDEELEPLVEKLEREIQEVCDRYRENGLWVDGPEDV